MPLFCLDAPVGDALGRVTEFHGWYLPDDGSADFTLELVLDGRPWCSFLRTQRPDVGRAYPDRPLAGLCGWRGDLVLPPDLPRGAKVRAALRARNAGGASIELMERTYQVSEEPRASRRRELALDLSAILHDPGGLSLEIEGVPHFHPAGRLPVVRLSERGVTHPYGPMALDVIERTKGPVLDFGAGIKRDEDLRGHVVNLEAVHLRHVDVVSTHRTLPFRSEVFDAAISQAVFEHLADPFLAARELFRVLRPGGVVVIDTAFLQPFHGDPDHYFNMTRPGLREIMSGFEIEECGIHPYQNPSLGLIMQLEAGLPFLAEGVWRDRVVVWLDALKREGGDLDRALGAAGREILAAGVFVRARKPRR